MTNSADLNKLRPDVAVNAKLWLADCRAQGLDVVVNNTVRDNQYQAYLYTLGRTVKKKPDGSKQGIVTNATITTFHGAGLAIDFYSKSTGWNDHEFFVKCGAIAKKYGFSWAGDWKSLVEYCHIQWDNHRTSTHKNAPQMPLFEEEHQMTKPEVDKFVQDMFNVHAQQQAMNNNVASPWAHSAWEKAKIKGIFDGTRPGAPLTRQEFAIILDRLGML